MGRNTRTGLAPGVGASWRFSVLCWSYDHNPSTMSVSSTRSGMSGATSQSLRTQSYYPGLSIWATAIASRDYSRYQSGSQNASQDTY